MSSTDYSKPLAALLRESTHEAHELVARSPGAQLLLSGGLSKDEYTKYLMNLWHIYDTLERCLEKHATHPALEPTYNPTLLARASSLAADISFLLNVEESAWKSHPMHVALMAQRPRNLSAYVERIQALGDSSDPAPLLAHSYVRYLGDLSGGQTVRHVLAKAYDLDEASGSGISFYAFKELRSSNAASQGEMKRIKEWFREGINTAGNLGVETKASIIEEANTAFALNANLFTSITGNSRVAVTHDATDVNKGYTLSQVVSVILAVCIAHFLLVVGGFTGSRGYQKLIELEHWFTTLWARYHG